MSATNWLTRSSGLVVPAMGVNPLGLFQPCGSGEDCCDGIPTSECTAGPCTGGSVPTYLDVTLTAPDNGLCDSCSDMAITHKLPFLGQSGSPPICLWTALYTMSCVDGEGDPYGYQLQVNYYRVTWPFGASQLIANLATAINVATWSQSPVSNDCLNWNETLDFDVSLDTVCTNYPATITVAAGAAP